MHLKITCFFLFLTFSIWSQEGESNTYDSLINNAVNNTQKLNVLDSISSILLDDNKEIAASYIKKSILLAKEEKEYSLLIKKLDESLRHYEIGGKLIDIDFITETINELITDKERLSNKNLGHLYFLKGRMQYTFNKSLKGVYENLDQSIHYLKKANSENSKLYAQVVYTKASVLSENGDIINALNYSTKATELYRKLKDTIMTNTALSIKADLMSKNGIFKEAEKIRDSIYKSAQQINDDYLMIYLKINQGIDYEIQNIKHKNLKGLLEVLPSAKKMEESYPIISGILYARIASLYASKGNMDSTEYFFEKLKETPLNYKMSSEFLYAKSAYYLHKKELDSALFYANQSYTIVKEGELQYLTYQNQELLSDIYEEKNNLEESLNYTKQATKLKDSLNNIIRGNAFSYYQTLYETEKKEKEIQKLEQENKLQVSKGKNQVALFIITSLILCSIIYLYKQKAKKKENRLKRSRKELNRFKTLFEMRSDEKDELIKKITSLQSDLKVKIEEDKLDELTTTKILTQEDWVRFKKAFNQIYPHFFRKIELKNIKLTSGEERLIALEKLNLKTKEIANALGIAEKSVRMSRYRLRKKLGIKDLDNLKSFFSTQKNN